MILQSDDILAPVRQKLLDEDQNKLAKVPQDLRADFGKQGGWAGLVSGASAGAALGAYATTAIAGTAIPDLGLVAAVPLAVIVGIMGYFGGAKAGSKVKKD